MLFTLTDKYRFVVSVFGSAELSKNEKDISVKCPLCGKENSTKKKLVIRVEDDLCHCWVCGYKARSLIFLLKKLAPDRIKEYAEKFKPVKVSSDALITNQSDLEFPDDFSLIIERNDSFSRSALLYLQSRGLNEDDVYLYKLGASNSVKWNRRIIMPSFDENGSLNYCVGRAIDKRAFPKYMMPQSDKNDIIFNDVFVDWSKEIVLCEGPFDYVKCGDNAIPLLGSSLSENSALFEKLILNQTPIALALDSDMLYTKTQTIARKLQEYTIPVRLVVVDTDPGDMTREEFQVALSAAEQFSWSKSLMLRLKKATNVSLAV